jgi:rhodanese-related sulfurtransferase/predicted transcriptional regulator
MSANGPKRLAFEQFAMVARALGNGHRLELLDVLAQGERGVDRLAEAAGLTVGNASQHLQYLWRAGVVTRKRIGTQIVYAIADPEVIALVRCLWKVAERNVAALRQIVQEYYRDRDSLEPMSRDELLARLSKGAVYVLDVRPPDEYAAGHVPGAVSVPLGDMKRRLRRIPKGKEIVACCRGPYCVYAYEAVEILRRAGYSARRLQGGFLEWRAAGLPVASPSVP